MNVGLECGPCVWALAQMILELGVSLISTDMDVQMTVALTSTVHQLLDKFQVMTKNGSDTDICVTIKKASAVRACSCAWIPDWQAVHLLYGEHIWGSECVCPLRSMKL